VRAYGASVRFIVAITGLFTTLVLVAPIHP
jgi:hypothetical protein